MGKVSMGFNETKDFGYLLQHPNAAELITKILTSSVVTKGEDYGDITPDLWSTCDLGFCKVSFDRKSEETRYRVYFDGSQKDFEDFAEVVAFILGRWY